MRSHKRTVVSDLLDEFHTVTTVAQSDQNLAKLSTTKGSWLVGAQRGQEALHVRRHLVKRLT
jgi:hypothetical protein